MNLTNKRVVFPDIPKDRFKNFDDVGIRDLNLPLSIFSQVDVKFPVSVGGNIQLFILLDMTGCKIKAVARGGDVSFFNFSEKIKEGCIYTLHRVIFKEIFHGVEFLQLQTLMSVLL